MDFSRPELTALQERVANDYLTRYSPISKTPRYTLLSVLAKTDSGMYHQLYGDLVYLSRQIFPDTADSENLRSHWSDRVPPLAANQASGPVQFSGTASTPIPAGILLQHSNGQEYYFPDSAKIGTDGTVSGTIKASVNGSDANLSAGEKLSIISTVPPGVASTVTVVSPGITGGVDEESDDAYLSRVLLYLRSTNRYGKKGDFAAWAIDSSPEVTDAWEFKNFGVFGALLIQVVQGTHLTGLSQVTNLAIVKAYIDSLCAPTLYTVRTPEILLVNPTVALLDTEDTTTNRATAISRMKTWMSLNVKPGSSVTALQLRDAIVDGLVITDASMSIAIGASTKLQILDIGTTSWA
jgi:uncharacterized phage protein gp47/JayE